MRFSRKYLGIPYYIFLGLFVIAPLVVLFYYAFTNGSGQFTLMNFAGFFTNPNTLGTLLYSFAIAAVTTVVCVLLAYPLAYILATGRLRRKSGIIMIFVMPMWINFSLRITALKEVLTFLEGNLAMCERKRSVPESNASAFDARCHERCLHGVSSGNDELCCSGYALQQHIYHGLADRQLLLRV